MGKVLPIRRISFLFTHFYAPVTAAIRAFLVARIAACFADTAFSGSFNPNALLSHSCHRQQRNCFRLLFLAPHQSPW